MRPLAVRLVQILTPRKMRVHIPKGPGLKYITKSSRKTKYLMNTLYITVFEIMFGRDQLIGLTLCSKYIIKGLWKKEDGFIISIRIMLN